MSVFARKVTTGIMDKCCAIKVPTSVGVCTQNAFLGMTKKVALFWATFLGQLCWQIRALGFSNLAD